MKSTSPVLSPISTPVRQIPFISKLERLLTAGKHITWSECGQNIVVQGIRTEDFTQELGGIGLSNKPESFIRQLNTYGFRKLQEPLDASLVARMALNADQVSVYHNSCFTRHHRDIPEIHAIGKRKPVNNDREQLIQAQAKIQELEEENVKLVKYIHQHYVVNPSQTNTVQQLDATNLLLSLNHTRLPHDITQQSAISIPIQNIPVNILNIQTGPIQQSHLPQVAHLQNTNSAPLPQLPVTLANNLLSVQRHEAVPIITEASLADMNIFRQQQAMQVQANNSQIHTQVDQRQLLQQYILALQQNQLTQGGLDQNMNKR